MKAVRKAVMEGKEPNAQMLDDGPGLCTVGVSFHCYHGSIERGKGEHLGENDGLWSMEG